MAGKQSEETRLAVKLWQEQKGAITIAQAAKLAKINPTTLYRALFPKGKRKHEKELAICK